MSGARPVNVLQAAAVPGPKKLHGRAFYESIGSPKYIVAPMVDQSEFAWRMLTRSFLPEAQRSTILAYSPMLHARLFAETQTYRDSHFQPTRQSPDSSNNPSQPQPWLDGNPAVDRPLIVQFCANDPNYLLEAAKVVAAHCDAVDLNLGCPQGIARKGHYGSFLQEDQELIHRLIRTLHDNLPVPVTAKIRILDTKEATLAYARNVLDAGASILTVHGRRREQKGHLTGLADWGMIRYLRENLPPETVMFANGNVLQRGDLERCLEATGADGVMSAEGNLSDPAIFAPVPLPIPTAPFSVRETFGEERSSTFSSSREFWRGRDGRDGWRVDAILRRYLDILHRYVMGKEPPSRRPLFVPGDDDASLLVGNGEVETSSIITTMTEPEAEKLGGDNGEPARKKRKRAKAEEATAAEDPDGTGSGKKDKCPSPNVIAVKAHLFHLLRHFISRHTDVRDALARTRLGPGYLDYLEKILDTVERKVAQGLLEYEKTNGENLEDELAADVAKAKGVKPTQTNNGEGGVDGDDDLESSIRTVRNCKRPWWVAQPIVRPLPKEAAAKGAVTLKGVNKGNSQLQKQPPKRESQPQSDSLRREGSKDGPNNNTLLGDEQTEVLDVKTNYATSALVSG